MPFCTEDEEQPSSPTTSGRGQTASQQQMDMGIYLHYNPLSQPDARKSFLSWSVILGNIVSIPFSSIYLSILKLVSE